MSNISEQQLNEGGHDVKQQLPTCLIRADVPVTLAEGCWERGGGGAGGGGGGAAG